MKIEFKKTLEFIYALQAMILYKYSDVEGELKFIHLSYTEYFLDIYEMLKNEDLKELEYFFKFALRNTADSAILAVALDDNYNLKYEPPLHTNLSKKELRYFVDLIKNIANRVNWDEFFKDHETFYSDAIKKFCKLPDGFNLDEYIKFYDLEPNSFNYIPTFFIWDAFGISDDATNFYCIQGFNYYDKEEDLVDEIPFLIDNIFHEFSHPICNAIVDKYFYLIEYPEKLYEFSKRHGLPEGYSMSVRTVYYEYLVRSVAYILSAYYCVDTGIVLKHNLSLGFVLIDKFVERISYCIDKYDSFEEMYVSEIIPFINGLVLEGPRKCLK